MASKLTKKINSRFNPTLLSGYPVYAAGGAIDPYSMMMQQGQQILSSAGTGMDNYFTNKRPEKANLGSAFFSNYLSGGMGIPGAVKGVGALINRKGEFEAQQDLQNQQQQEGIKRDLISNLPAQHYYTPTFAMGGKMYPDGGEVDAISGAAPKYWQIPIKEREDFDGNFIGKRRLGNDKESVPHGDWARYYSGQPLKGYNIQQRGMKSKDYDGYKPETIPYNLVYSQYKPSVSSGQHSKYIANREPVFMNQVLEYFNDNYEGKKLRPSYMVDPKNPKNYNRYSRFADLGNFTIDKGSDDKGDYISYYDIWNRDINDNPDVNKTEAFGTFKPFEVYDRIYVDKDSTGRYVPREAFKYGGKISPSEIAKGTKEEMEHTTSRKVSRKTALDHLKEDPKYYTKLKKAGLADSYAGGGMLNSYANGGNLDNTTVFQGGGSHQENQLGGIPQGTNALVEEGEVRFKDYIFSNRIPYTKKK